jgi:hypothetical protein
MMPKNRAARKRLPPMPLSELPMMKSLLAMATPLAGDKVPRNSGSKGDPKTQLTMLRLTIIDKLQVLALKRPHALIIVAQVLNKLLDQQLEVVDEHLESARAVRRKANARVAELPKRTTASASRR